MKKIMAGMLSACIAFSPVVTPSFAAGNDIMLISEKETKEADDMQSALIAVKSKIQIPEELTEFTYRLSYSGGNYSKNKYWNFEWRDKEYKRNITVKCNEKGNILSYSTYDSEKSNSEPTYLKEELIDNAKSFIHKVLPEVSDNIILESSEFSGVYSGTYLYRFERIENGVRMPDDTILVSVNYETGDVKNFNVNWTFDVEIPSAETNITIDEARAKIGENVEMKLRYMNKSEEVDGENITKAYLVYVPDKSYMAVDAKTGEVYDTHDEFHDMDELKNSNKEMLSAGATFDMAVEEAELTEEEISKINEMKNLITKEDAIKAVTSKRDVLLIDENSKAVDARLTQKYTYMNNEEKGYVWNLNFNDPRTVDYNSNDTYRAYTNVTVDAETGKILSFHSSVKNYYDAFEKEWENVKVKYTSEECQKIFEKFVESLESERFSNTKLSSAKDNAYLLKYINEEPVYGGYSYNYSRMNEGVEYSFDNISGKVDGVSGKIYSYNVNWTNNVEFESPKNAMTPDEAYKAYSEKDGFELVYEINNKHYIENEPTEKEFYDYSELYVLEKEARLVYRTDINPHYISPFTGEQLDYLGNKYEDVNEKEYSDISGFWGERSVRLITDMGYVFEGNEFLPEKAIAKEECFELLQKVGCYVNAKDYEELDKITKLEFIKMIIKNLGLEKVAVLSDIYKVSFSDAEQISNEDIGYAALANGLGLISGDTANKLNPNRELTRIEAVCIALKLAQVK